MSDLEPRGTVDQIPEHDDLCVRRIGGHQYRVLSLGGDARTCYLVNVKDLTCSCPDYEFNRDAPEVCKHLAVALDRAPANPSLEREVFDNLVELWSQANAAVQDIQDVRDVAQASQDAQAAWETAQAGSEDSADGSDDLDRDPVDGIRDWLDTGFAQPEHVDVRAGSHAGTDGVVLEPDNQTMSDGVYESFKSLVNAVDGSHVHIGFGDDPCQTCGDQDGEFWYFIPAADVAGVVG
jgi:hypothetical protein